MDVLVNVDIDDQVATAAQFLDHRVPGWFYQVDTNRLSIQSYDRCVIGQVFGVQGDNADQVLDWTLIMFRLFGPDRATRVYGHGNGTFTTLVFCHPVFHRAWVREVKNRLSAGDASVLNNHSDQVLVS